MAKSRDDYIKEHGGDDITFNLVDKNTVKRLQKKGDVKLPYKDLDEEKDEKWNTKLLNSKLMENIISGKPVTELASSIYDVVGRNEKSAMRNARTMLTGAENAGRQDSYEDLTEQGVVMKKVWIATPDDHTRESHFDLDGEEVDVDEEFSNGCMYPGDPNGDPSEVYNCRCSMRTHIVGFKAKDGSVVEVKGDRDKTMHEEQMEAEEEHREEKEKQKEEKITVVEKSNPDNLPEKALLVIGQKGNPIDPDTLLKTVNPHFEEDENYRVNCQRCASCYELGRRGYDVEAMPFDGHYPDIRTIFKQHYVNDYDNYISSWNDKYPVTRSSKATAKTIEKAMTDWGEGSRAILEVEWRGSKSCHVVNVENVNGVITIFDTQSGENTTNIIRYLQETTVSKTTLIRTDNLEWKDLTKDLHYSQDKEIPIYEIMELMFKRRI